jgi:hypothetical protein
MRIPDDIQKMIAFAHFAQEHRISPGNLGELLHFARRAHTAGVNYANTGSRRAHTAEINWQAAFENLAVTLGFMVDWPGLWPVLEKNGNQFHLPET